MSSSQDKIQADLLTFVNSPANKHCAECNARQPRWASTNLGVFICLRCSGIHRSLGVHITKVKSINLDTWTRDQVQYMVKQGGNTAVNKTYEAAVPSTRSKPTEDSTAYTTEQFIRDKYERKLFCKRTSPNNKGSPTKHSKLKAIPMPATTTDSDDGYETASDEDEGIASAAAPPAQSSKQHTSNVVSPAAHTNGKHTKQSSVALTPPKRNAASKRLVSKNAATKQSAPSKNDLLPDLSKLDLFATDGSAPANNQQGHSTQQQQNNGNNDSNFAFFNEANTAEANAAQQPANGNGHAVGSSPTKHSTKSILDLFDSAPSQQPQQQQQSYGQMPMYNQQYVAQPNMYVPQQQQPAYGGAIYGGQYQQQQVSPRQMSQQPAYGGYGQQAMPMMQPVGLYGMQQQPYMHQQQSFGGGMPQQPMYGQQQMPYGQPQQQQQQYMHSAASPPTAAAHNNNDFFSVPAASASSSHNTSQPSAQVGNSKPDAFADLAGLSFGQKIQQPNGGGSGQKTGGAKPNAAGAASQQFNPDDFSFI